MINTIFYYAETKAEYLQKVSAGEILARTIVFVEDTGEIYKNGKLFSNYKLLVDSIELVRQEIDLKIQASKDSLLTLISNLRQYVNDTFSEELQTISQELESYEDMLERLRAELANLQEDLGSAGEEIDSLKGLIRDYAVWKSATNGTLTDLQRLLDAQNGIILTQGNLLDTLKNSITNYEERINLIEGTFNQYMELYDITNKVKEIIGREINLGNGLLHDFATLTDVDDAFRNSIDVWFNALTPSWTQLTSKVYGLENTVTLMSGFDSRIETLEGLETSLSRQFASWSDEYSEFLSALQTGANSEGSFFHLIASGNTSISEVAAEIFGEVNGDSSSITIKADKVFGLGDWIMDNVTVNRLIAGNSPNRILINSTDGIKHEGEKFKFNIDGSGQVAGGKISWDSNGDITINGQIISTSNISDLGTYFNNSIGVKIGDWGTGTLKQYIDSALSGKVDNGTLDTIAQRVTTLEGNSVISSDTLATTLRGFYNNYLGDEGTDNTVTIAQAISGIKKINSYFTDENNNVVGLSSKVDISSKVENYISNNNALSALTTWANTFANGSVSAGFNLKAAVENMVDGKVSSASITAVVTDDQLSRLNISADTIALIGSDITIGDFIKVYERHFTCLNFDVVDPNYYALRRYLIKQRNSSWSDTQANSFYNDIINGLNLLLDENFNLYSGTSPKYIVDANNVLKARGTVMMDWSGITVLKDYLSEADRSDTGDHYLHETFEPSYYSSDYPTSTALRALPDIDPNKVNVLIGSLLGNGSLAWGKIKWSDKYQYVNGKLQANVTTYGSGSNAVSYWEPIIENENGSLGKERNGVLVITDAYLINPKIVNSSTISLNLVPSIDYI